MSYRLCCGSLSRSDLSIAMGVAEQARPSASQPPNASTRESMDIVHVNHTSAPTVENIAEVCHHHNASSIEERREENNDMYQFDFKRENSVTRPKAKTLNRRKSDRNMNKKQHKFWTFRFKKRSTAKEEADRLNKESHSGEVEPCVCTGYRRTEDHVTGPGVVFSVRSLLSNSTGSPLQSSSSRKRLSMGAGPCGPGPSTGATAARAGDLHQLVPAPPQRPPANIIDLTRFNPEDYPTEDVDELRIAQRARDIELGIEVSPQHIVYPHLMYGGGSPPSNSSSSTISSSHSSLTDPGWNLVPNFQSQCTVTTLTYPSIETRPSLMQPVSFVQTTPTPSLMTITSPLPATSEANYSEYGSMSTPVLTPTPSFIPPTIHTQVDYIHCLVPDLNKIAACSFYWGVMDRYEAEKLLENRPEGSFLLRDSAQEEFLFSVSFRRYGRSLHARIEQWNHKFSFDSHDPGVFAADSVTSLIEHYKDPTCCMFFEPLLTLPLNRSFPFSLQHVCRSVICAQSSYDSLNYLPLPKPLRDYLKYYHYKQKVRVRRFEFQH